MSDQRVSDPYANPDRASGPASSPSALGVKPDACRKRLQRILERLRIENHQQISQRPVPNGSPGEPEKMPEVNGLFVQPLTDRFVTIRAGKNRANDRRQNGG